MSQTHTAAAPERPTTDAAVRARASIAFGRRHGYYRLLFDAGPVDAAAFAQLAGITEHHARAWLDEQVAAGVLRAVIGPSGEYDELLLPGEHVPILLADADDGADVDHELDAARALLAEHRGDLPRALVPEHVDRFSAEHPSGS